VRVALEHELRAERVADHDERARSDRLGRERLLPIFCTAVGEAIQLAIESKIWLMNAPSGALRLICT
jgi:hypothetical protein